MKVENVTPLGSGGSLTYKFSEIETTYGGTGAVTLNLNHDSTNCKLCYIHGSGSLVSCKTDDVRKQVLNEMLNLPSIKGMVILNTTQKSVFDFINKNYEVYYAHEVPVGYNAGYQYHICIRNHIRPNSSCRVPEKAPTKEEKGLTKVVIAKKLENILRKKRRKADYIEEFVASL